MEEQTMPLSEFRENVGHRVDAAHFTGEVTIITKNGKPRAALVPIDVLRRYLDQTD